MHDEMHLEPEPVPPPPLPRAGRGRVVVLGVLVVLASFAGGFVAGTATDDDVDRGDEIAALGVGDDEASAGSAGVGADGPTASTIVATGEDLTDAPDAVYGQPVRVRLFRRDTAAGLSVRVHRSDHAGPPPCEAGQGWCPPPQCNPTSSIEALVVGEWGIAQGGGPGYALDGAPVRVLGVISSWSADDPIFGVIVRTGDGVDAVRLTHGGTVDEMAPIDGLAVVAVPDPSFDPRGAFPPTGAQIEVVRGGAGTTIGLDDALQPSPECVPPPPEPEPLPPAGAQPDDAVAADAAVRATFGAVFGNDDEDQLLRGVDDPTGLGELRDELRARYPDMIGNVTYELGELVFTSPTEAVYHFRPIVPSSGPFMFQLGGARLIDGQWKLTRATVCTMFGLGGAGC